MLLDPRRLALCLLLLATTALAYTNPSRRVEVRTDKPDAVYARGDTVEFRIRLLEGTEPLAGQTLKYRLSLDNYKTLSVGTVVSAAKPVVVTGKLDEPGFLRCDVTLEGTGTKAAAAAAIDPLNIAPSTPVPDDFDAFWAKRRALLAAEPPQPKLTPATSPSPKAELLDVEVNCPGSPTPLRGYFAKPVNAKPKSLPAILMPHAASAVSVAAEYNALALDFNAHGILNGQPPEYYVRLEKGELAGYPRRESADPDKFYFNGMYLRLMRAIEFLTAQPEWDGRTLIVRGSSQGAGQSIAAAGLDPRVTLIVGNVPAMCDHTGSLAGRVNGWPNLLSGKTKDQANPDIVRTVRYFDAANLATRAKAEAVFLVGFIDTTTPPTSIYAMYNAYAGPKRMVNVPDMAHEAREVYNTTLRDAIKAHLAK